MVKRVVNFNPGPAALPLDVLKIVQEEMLDYQNSGMSLLESSHRAKEFETVNDAAIAWCMKYSASALITRFYSWAAALPPSSP